MDMTEFRTFVSEIRTEPNRSAEKIIENEKKIYGAVMSLSIDGDDGEEIICEALSLLFDFPAVLQLLRLMAEKAPCDNESPDFLTARTLFASVKS